MQIQTVCLKRSNRNRYEIYNFEEGKKFDLNLIIFVIHVIIFYRKSHISKYERMNEWNE